MSEHAYHGVTITLAGTDEVRGSYVTGEPYIVLPEPTQLTHILNPSFQGYGECLAIGGSMLNPSGLGGQGFTNQYVTDDSGSHINYYDSTKNVGANLPITVSPGDMLLVSVARNDPSVIKKVGTYKIVCFSFVAVAPPLGSLRPGFYGTDRALAFTESDIKKERLQNVPRAGLSDVPSISYMSDINRFPALPWFSWGGGWESTVVMPQVNCANKNNENTAQGSTDRFALASMWLCLDYTPEQKRTLALKIVQNGIDLASFFAAGGTMHGGGSHQTGYKTPLFWAAVLTDHPQILGYSRDPHLTVEGARSMWRISQGDVGRYWDNPYLSPVRWFFLESEVGMYWWGMNHAGSPNLDVPPNCPSPYPYYDQMARIFPTLVAARLMGKTSDFGWGINYHYMQEYISRYGHGIVGIAGSFFQSFYNAVWPSLPPLVSETSPTPEVLDTAIIEPGQSLALKPDPWGHPIRYTTNGDTPTSGSPLAAGAIPGITPSMNVKVRSFPADGQDPSEVATIVVTVITNDTPAPPALRRVHPTPLPPPFVVVPPVIPPNALGWGVERLISTTGDAVVETTGTLVTAINLGETATRTVSGVAFVGQTAIGTLDSAAVSAEFYTGGGIGADFTAMMHSLAYASGSVDGEINLTGLTVGDTYLLQVFSSDDRSTYAARTQALSIAGYTSASMVTGSSFAVTCRFVATATSHTLTISDPDGLGSVQLQALQLRVSA